MMPTGDPKPVNKGLLELLVPPTDHGAQQAQGCLGNWHPSMETGRTAVKSMVTWKVT